MTACLEYYEVRYIATSFIVYRGESLTKAARMLNPGTCYGKGSTLHEAHEQVRAAVRQHGGQISLDTVR